MAKKSPKGKYILSSKQFQKGPNGNPDWLCLFFKIVTVILISHFFVLCIRAFMTSWKSFFFFSRSFPNFKSIQTETLKFNVWQCGCSCVRFVTIPSIRSGVVTINLHFAPPPPSSPSSSSSSSLAFTSSSSWLIVKKRMEGRNRLSWASSASVVTKFLGCRKTIKT